MSAARNTPRTLSSHEPYFLEILSQNSQGWQICLPPGLQIHQGELELLLNKVFGGRPRTSDNLELAQQLTINWCVSKCRKEGIKLEDCWPT
ncbi:MAG: hypothetical protein U0105_07730 [Candidatus Obscuribacterales bacterium]